MKTNQITLFLRSSLMIFIGLAPLTAESGRWGWASHRYINENAVDYLPPEMSFFQAQRDFLRDHATDPDSDNQPGYYHYIDIDYYPEFILGTLPHDRDSLEALYSPSIVIDNGTVPWVIDQWMTELTNMMAGGYWSSVWQIAAELGHYVADSHQPLHLTLNYNGGLTGKYGIHSRYETQMMYPYLSQLPLPSGTAIYWDSPLDSVFEYIEDIYPVVDLVMAADDSASSVDPNYGSTYIDLMWAQLDSVTTDAVHRAILNLASIWYTCWINAGSPVLNTNAESIQPENIVLYPNFPNPFNPVTEFTFYLPQQAFIDIAVYDINGRIITNLENGNQSAGFHNLGWDGKNQNGQPVSSGMYILRVVAENYVATQKMMLLQ